MFSYRYKMLHNGKMNWNDFFPFGADLSFITVLSGFLFLFFICGGELYTMVGIGLCILGAGLIITAITTLVCRYFQYREKKMDIDFQCFRLEAEYQHRRNY